MKLIRWLHIKLITRKRYPCGPTGDDMFCACGCGGNDERCYTWRYAYYHKEEVPKTHTCCSVRSR